LTTAWVGHRRRGRRKSEQRVTVYDTADLLQRFECTDVDSLLAKLNAIGVKPHATNGPGGSRKVFVSSYQLPND
jgi:hypothetical protein